MTKMPDKIYMHDSGVWSEFSTRIFEETEYTRSDLIPQPVTDEARAKALDDLDLVAKGVITSKEWLQRSYKTIKAALSQPNATLCALIKETHKAAIVEAVENTILYGRGDGLLGVLPVPEQPEAIQKVVEALTPITKILGVAPIDSEACSYYAGHLRDAVNAAHTAIGSLRAHQSELEAQQDHIKYLETVIIGHEMENADLRRAVVDLDEALSSVLEESGSGKTLTQVHYKDLITKAKAVQS